MATALVRLSLLLLDFGTVLGKEKTCSGPKNYSSPSWLQHSAAGSRRVVSKGTTYSLISSGDCIDTAGFWDINSTEECQEAIEALGYSTDSFDTVYNSEQPPGCVWKPSVSKGRFNIWWQSGVSCSSGKSCICKNDGSTAESYYVLVESGICEDHANFYDIEPDEDTELGTESGCTYAVEQTSRWSATSVSVSDSLGKPYGCYVDRTTNSGVQNEYSDGTECSAEAPCVCLKVSPNSDDLSELQMAQNASHIMVNKTVALQEVEDEESISGEEEEHADMLEESEEEAVEDHALNSRSLLSSRHGARVLGSCEYCSCFLTSAASCGTEAVTSGAQCGWDTITSAADCGSSIFKACKVGRRRRWYGKWKCSTKSVAKSCKVAKSCNIDLSCDVAESFDDCLTEITSQFKSTYKKYLNFVTDSGCTSADACAKNVKKGLDSAWEYFEDLVNDGISSTLDPINDVLGVDIGTTGTVVQDGASSLVSDMTSKYNDLESNLLDYAKGTFPAFSKYSLGNVCLENGEGFWSMAGTDCGAFTSMGKIFTDITNAETHFKSTVSSLETCFKKTGLLDFPTPFFDLEVEDYCLPDFVVTAMEYFIGAVIYSTNVVQTLVTDLGTVIKNFATNDLGLLQIGKSMLETRQRMKRLGGNLSRDISSSKDKGYDGECGTEADWGLAFMVQAAWTWTKADGSQLSASAGFGISLGCIGGSVQNPNLVFQVGLAAGGDSASAGVDASGGIDIGLEYSDTFSDFSEARWKASSSLVITPTLDLCDLVPPVGPIPASVGLPIALTILPNPSNPTGFAFSIAPNFDPCAGKLAQLGSRVKKASQQASQAAVQQTPDQKDQMLNGMTAAMHELAKPDGLRQVFADAKPDRKQIIEQGSHIDKHKSALSQAARGKRRTSGISVASETSFQFCITIGDCSR